MANFQIITAPVSSHSVADAQKAQEVITAVRVFKVAGDMLRDAGFSCAEAADLLRHQWGAQATA